MKLAKDKKYFQRGYPNAAQPPYCRRRLYFRDLTTASRESELASHITTGELTADENSISEGIGSDRITTNFDRASIDLACSTSDVEFVPLPHQRLDDEGGCFGGSSGVDAAGAICLARALDRATPK